MALLTRTATSTTASRGASGQTSRPSLRHTCAVLPRINRSSFTIRAAAAAGKGLDNIPGFGGGISGGIKIRTGGKLLKPEDVVIESEAGIDYEPLRAALEAGEFQEADDITRSLLIQLAGPGAQERGWVYFTEVKNISVKDFKTMDDLWRAYSDGKFGFSVQKNLWSQTSKRWPKFFKRINWVQGENNIYRKWPGEFIYTKDAEKGHLPLTNALRGTELLQAIFNHPAFVTEAKNRPAAGSGGFDSPNL
eukprot:CAMPEP_0117668098 /NCGR_PEP_ID=MMETSP0804-20121206/11342_1 /TAXON_ID=1074897 /ORGANISM="Tetraselmis astigmatica, Strain CCMP880" /LENGTH=248 /DNA_ID=CAMNT_0005475915 /DNA_START=152 /DNA_END=898 /DNA_ORIENTATION=+